LYTNLEITQKTVVQSWDHKVRSTISRLQT